MQKNRHYFLSVLSFFIFIVNRFKILVDNFLFFGILVDGMRGSFHAHGTNFARNGKIGATKEILPIFLRPHSFRPNMKSKRTQAEQTALQKRGIL